MISCASSPIRIRGMVRFMVVIFLFALAIRVGLLFLLPNFDFIKPMEMERVARSFAEKGQLANPYATPTGATAHVLPLYPVLLGTIYRIWGTGPTGRMAQGLFSCTLAALRCALLCPLALFLGLDRRTAWLASIVSAFYIPAFGTEIRGSWDAPLAALFLMGLVCLAVLVARRRELSFPAAAGCGLCVGLAALLSSTLLVASAGFAAAGAWVFRRRWLRYLAWCGVCFVIVMLCLTPWALRNRRQLGKTIWLRSNFGLELWQAYHEGAGIGALETSLRHHPALSVEDSSRLGALGEVRYHESLEREAWRWIAGNPQKAAQLFAGHVIYFWFPPGQSFPIRLLRWLLTAVAGYGMWLLLARKAPAGYTLAVLWIVYPPIYYVVYWSSRYRYPMEWALVLAAATVPSALWPKYGSGLLARVHLERSIPNFLSSSA